MRLQSIFVASLVVFLALGAGVVLVVRKYRIMGIGLTRNAEANSRARAVRAHETLQRLASNPKLTVVRQTLPEDQGRGKKAVVLCVLSRHIVPVLLKAADPSQPLNPLIEQLESIDVEPVPYDNAELPALIAEIAAAKKRNTSQALAGDFNELLAALERETDPRSQVVFY